MASQSRPAANAGSFETSRAFARLDPVALGAGCGVVLGAALCLATLVLLLGDGGPTGPHLARLSWYLPGYRVTAGGAVVGLLEAGGLGFLGGAALAGLWNAYHRMFVALALARARARDARRELLGL